MKYDLAPFLLKTSTAYLVTQGSRDTFIVPTPHVRKIVDIFAKHGRCNITYWEFSGFDHLYRDIDDVPGGDPVIPTCAYWLKNHSEDMKGRRCMNPPPQGGPK